MATPPPDPFSSFPNGEDVLSDDPILAEVKELLRDAERHVAEGEDNPAMTLLTRVRALLLSDGTALSPEARRRREQTLEEMEALLEEIIVIRAMGATPSEGDPRNAVMGEAGDHPRHPH